jgi:group I intron endonuclease
MTVYEIKGPTGKKYYGTTICNVAKRMREHRHASKNLKYPLYLDAVKYGWDAFKVREICFGSNQDCWNIESALIINSKEKNESYNNATYKASGRKFSKEYCEAMSKRMKAMPKEFYSNNSKKGWQNHRDRLAKRNAENLNKLRQDPNFDKKRLEASKEAILKSMPEFDVFKGEVLIGTFKSKQDCAKKLGLHERSVYRYLDGERKHKSLTFKYKGGF